MSPIRPLPALQLRKASLSFLPQSSAPAAPFSSLHPVRSHVPSTVEVADTRHCKGGHRDERVKTEQVKRDEGGARKYQASPLRFSSRTLYLPPLPFSGRMHAASIADTRSPWRMMYLPPPHHVHEMVSDEAIRSFCLAHLIPSTRTTESCDASG
jgi:hypothetical protein